jgi:hypothetical protein
MEQLCDRERQRYGRIFRNLITLYVVRVGKPTDLGGIASHSGACFSAAGESMITAWVPAARRFVPRCIATLQFSLCTAACNNLCQTRTACETQLP